MLFLLIATRVCFLILKSVFGVLTIRKYENKGKWLVFAPFWWEHLFNEQFDTSEEAIKFIETRCEEYVDEVLEWVVPNTSLQEK